MEKVASLENHLDLWMTDTCNRYLHILTDLGVVDKKKASKLANEILEKRNAMLDEYVPFFVEAIFKILEDEKNEKT
tara:strand:- start:275 stop:502 length:228 start_codon:yes stop_codon:yes gene_type:complete